MRLNLPVKKEEFVKQIADSRVFGSQQEQVILQLVDAVYYLTAELKRVQAQPLALEWVNPDQACQILDKSAPTVRDMARKGLFDLDGQKGYIKGKRKMQYYLPGLRAYLLQTKLKPEVIEQRLARVGFKELSN